MRVMSAGDGYKYLRKTVASSDGDRPLSTPLTRYFIEEGTPPGRWLGKGVASLGKGELVVGDQVSEAQLQLLMGMGHDPITNAPLGRAFPAYKDASKRIEARIAKLDHQVARLAPWTGVRAGARRSPALWRSGVHGPLRAVGAHEQPIHSGDRPRGGDGGCRPGHRCLHHHWPGRIHVRRGVGPGAGGPPGSELVGRALAGGPNTPAERVSEWPVPGSPAEPSPSAAR